MGILDINDLSFCSIVKYYTKLLPMIVLSALLCNCASGKQRLPMFDPCCCTSGTLIWGLSGPELPS